MTWSKFDDAAPKSPKAVAAGNDAWSLWAAAIMYCNRHLTDGYITLAALASDCLPCPIAPAKARKLAEQLCAVRARPDGVGLFEHADGGIYKVHDFLDWNPSKVEVEAKRKLDRERKRTRPGVSAGGAQESDEIPRGIRPGIQTDSGAPRASARARPVPSRPVPPDPSRPDHYQSEAAAAAADVSQEPVENRSRPTPCPMDLPEKLMALGVHIELAQHLKVDAESVVHELRKFRDTGVVGKLAGQSRSHWAGKARQWVIDQAKQNKLTPPGAIEHTEHALTPERADLVRRLADKHRPRPLASVTDVTPTHSVAGQGGS